MMADSAHEIGPNDAIEAATTAVYEFRMPDGDTLANLINLYKYMLWDTQAQDQISAIRSICAEIARAAIDAYEAAQWFVRMEDAPRDETILVEAAAYEGLPGFFSTCRWHPDAGFCVDELRPVVRWRRVPKPGPSDG
jgi:hypothetical protein